ncbi:MAG: FMN-binding protein [Bacillota bacterium]
MKKALLLSLVLVVAVGLLAGCSKSVYQDGTYTAVSDSTDNGYMEAKVTIAKDKITAVELIGYDKFAAAKGESYPWDAYHQAIEDIPAQMVAENTWDVDGVAQATGTTEQSKQAAKRALELALTEPASTAKYFDGTFMGVSPADARGGITVVQVTIEGDVIKAVTAKSAQKAEDGSLAFKDESYPWAEYFEAIEKVPEQIVEANGVDVDGVAGATGTSTQIKEAVQDALNKATR